MITLVLIQLMRRDDRFGGILALVATSWTDAAFLFWLSGRILEFLR